MVVTPVWMLFPKNFIHPMALSPATFVTLLKILTEALKVNQLVTRKLNLAELLNQWRAQNMRQNPATMRRVSIKITLTKASCKKWLVIRSCETKEMAYAKWRQRATVSTRWRLTPIAIVRSTVRGFHVKCRYIVINAHLTIYCHIRN